MCIHCGITFKQDLSDAKATSGLVLSTFKWQKFPSSVMRISILTLLFFVCVLHSVISNHLTVFSDRTALKCAV